MSKVTLFVLIWKALSKVPVIYKIFQAGVLSSFTFAICKQEPPLIIDCNGFNLYVARLRWPSVADRS